MTSQQQTPTNNYDVTNLAVLLFLELHQLVDVHDVVADHRGQNRAAVRVVQKGAVPQTRVPVPAPSHVRLCGHFVGPVHVQGLVVDADQVAVHAVAHWGRRVESERHSGHLADKKLNFKT